MTEARIRKRKEYVDRKLAEYVHNVRKLAIENNHPWISVYLTTSLYQLEQAVIKQRPTTLGVEELCI